MPAYNVSKATVNAFTIQLAYRLRRSFAYLRPGGTTFGIEEELMPVTAMDKSLSEIKLEELIEFMVQTFGGM